MVVRAVVMVCVMLGAAGAARVAEAAEAGTGQLVSTSPSITGPRFVDLGNHAEIELPAGMILIERADAERLLRKAGEPSEGVVAIVQRPAADWSIILSYTDAGYIDDADASRLDAEELLAAYRSGNRADNERRTGLGTPEIVVDGWTEPPRYDRAQHHLVWGIAAHRVGGGLVNHFTRILGRDGFLSVNLVDVPESMARSRAEARAVVEATRFRPGARYEDHTPGDRRSGAGLRGLVRGGSEVAVAAGLGLLAQVVLAWRPELVVALLLGIGGVLGRLRWLVRRAPRRAGRCGPATAAATDATGALVGPTSV